ncbi:glycosyltransferase family 2 protein [Paracoccus haeundaensis]|uniref:Glycosyltransferase family 2 protein n=1 Tax=Paracoccus haeundaensis TaxID=225362 RepID=A0A5C4R264_9RHOB|nr:glycosyltransferase family 2 protein [Paracoccus haeundaensis]TNH37804.1 glycosyltransferase family 2 protein [Paracoccus haeundaensis]
MKNFSNTDDLVSVIVPSYCHEEYLLDCLVSIHDQNYKNIELVVVDDVSTDSSYLQAETLLNTSFANRFCNVILLQNDFNMGAHASINRGICASNGSHIAIINSDDLYHPHRISMLMEALSENGSELGFSFVKVIFDSEKPMQLDPFFRLLAVRQSIALKNDISIGFSLLRSNQAISTGNLLFTRKLYDRAGPFLPLKYCHDWDFILQSLFYTEPVVVKQEHYSYRIHGTNSFSTLGYLAGTETEVVLRRLFRRGLMGKSPNPLFPCESNWPGYFELFIQECGYQNFLARERGDPGTGWRTITPTANVLEGDFSFSLYGQ